MAKETGILSLGTRKDATTWENGCKKLGFTAPHPIKKPSPNLDEIAAFFSRKSHWLFLAGHFGNRTLYNDSGNVEITFSSSGVTAKVDGDKRVLKKNTADFQQDKNCEVVVWGGCSVFDGQETIRQLRKLFGNHVLLGFAGLTGWKVVDALLGGGFIKPRHFFNRVTGQIDNPAAIRNAWLRTALQGYGGGGYESRFRAIDPNGQEWHLRNNKIVRGRKIS